MRIQDTSSDADDNGNEDYVDKKKNTGGKKDGIKKQQKSC